MTDPIEVLATACATSQTDHNWPSAIDAVVRLRDAAQRVGEADNASLAGWGQEADRALREMVEALEELRDALAPFGRQG